MQQQTTRPVSAGRAFDSIASATEWIGRFILVALVLLVLAEALLRSLMNFSLGFAEEVTGYFVVALTLFGAARALREGSLFEVGFLLAKRSMSVRRALQAVYACLSLFICGVLAVKSAELVMSSFSRGKFAPTVLHTPLWIPQLLLPIGFCVIGVFLIEKLLLLWQFERSGRP